MGADGDRGLLFSQKSDFFAIVVYRGIYFFFVWGDFRSLSKGPKMEGPKVVFGVYLLIERK